MTPEQLAAAEQEWVNLFSSEEFGISPEHARAGLARMRELQDERLATEAAEREQLHKALESPPRTKAEARMRSTLERFFERLARRHGIDLGNFYTADGWYAMRDAKDYVI